MAPPRKTSHKGKRRHFSTPEEIQQQMNQLNVNSDDDIEEKNEPDGSSDNDSSDDDEQKIVKPKGVSGLIEIENPNRNPRRAPPTEQVQLTRREREEVEKQQAKERYQKLHAEGKTDQAKADLARLELIRKQREEANLKREMERQIKNEQSSGKTSSNNTASLLPTSGQQRLTAAQKQSQIRAKKSQQNK
ncbi:28 kDa heat- and acid-stable phosphoprotein-like protein [Euroglyphus maynei]|uniref:28 kDa heat-and acid-stable phosphoprotein-like protein n=1 Tax=Euroglyphus maynei TaxID=6958 RepID=A0A1Y3BAK1_EURMA|nr:28 kDa heat- and acid-stable phosphoprotein-like protein [Euroglyphus maynei]